MSHAKIAACSGGLGDIVYAIKLMKAIGIEKLYVKDKALENGSTTFKALRDLIIMQGIDCLPTSGDYDLFQYEPGLKFDIDLDLARNQPERNKHHIIKSFFRQFTGSIPLTWRNPWLTVKDQRYTIGTNNFALIALTPRWREGSRVNWASVYKNKIKAAGYKEIYFIGFRSDHETFCKKYGSVKYFETPTLLDAMYLINQCRTLYTNQNVMLTIAQGLGKNYFLEHKRYRTNTLMHTRNEILL